jgi:ferrochelatase
MNPPAPTRCGVLLVNLGTPDAPTPAALRRYLAEFLSDRRVVEIPRLLWLPLLYGLILPLRAPRSAAKYASVWQAGGSPLALGSAALTAAVDAELRRLGHDLVVRLAMRYGRPSTAAALDALQAAGVTHLLVVPLYPQYSAATTASSLDAVMSWFGRTRRQPALRSVRSFADAPCYIEALAHSVRQHWAAHGRGDHLLMSFHGLPQRSENLGDPYADECRSSARLLARELGLEPDQWSLAFQSRFGRQAWLQPYTASTLRDLASAGCARLDVICPGFSVDCLETLEEIAIEGRQIFVEAGGSEFRYIPCLNADADWTRALAALISEQLKGWPSQRQSPPAAPDGR